MPETVIKEPILRLINYLLLFGSFFMFPEIYLEIFKFFPVLTKTYRYVPKVYK